MKTPKSFQRHQGRLRGERARSIVTAVVSVLLCCQAQCNGQGTMTFTFEGQPRGTRHQTGPYYEGAMQFLPIPMGSLYLSGGGFTGYPDNGTGYLEVPDIGVRFGPTNAFPATAPFNLVSFDAAEIRKFWRHHPHGLRVQSDGFRSH